MKALPGPDPLAIATDVGVAGRTVSLALVVVTVLAESLPAGSVALAVAVMVPSPNPEALMALTAVGLVAPRTAVPLLFNDPATPESYTLSLPPALPPPLTTL